MLGAYLHSFIFAKILGMYLVVMAIVMITKPVYYRNVLMNIGEDKTAVFTAASFSLIFGLFLVSVHNFWGWEAYLLITIVAWLIVIKSVLWLAIPESMSRAAMKMYSGKMYYLSTAIVTLLGIWILSYAAYFGPLID